MARMSAAAGYYSIQHNGWRGRGGVEWSGERERVRVHMSVCLSVFKVMTDETMKERGNRTKGEQGARRGM